MFKLFSKISDDQKIAYFTRSHDKEVTIGKNNH